MLMTEICLCLSKVDFYRRNILQSLPFGVSLQDLRNIHRSLLSDLALVKCVPGTTPTWTSADKTIPGCFVKHKMKLVIYGDYCANLQKAQEQLDRCLRRQQVKDIVEVRLYEHGVQGKAMLKCD